MSTIRFVCPHCGKTFERDLSLAGRMVRCRDCQNTFTIPTPQGVVIPAAPMSPPPRSKAPSTAPSSSRTIRFACPKCGKRFEKDAALAGQRARCKDCLRYFTIPTPEPIPAPVPVPVSAASPEPNWSDLPLDAEVPYRGRSKPGPRSRLEVEAGRGGRSWWEGPPVWAYAALGCCGLLLLGGLTWMFWPAASQGARPAVAREDDGGTGAEVAVAPPFDPDLDAVEPAGPVRSAVVSQHEKALRDLTAAVEDMTTALRTVRDIPSLRAALPRIQGATNRLQQIGEAGRMLPRPSPAEGVRIRQTAAEAARGAIDRLQAEIDRVRQLPGFENFKELAGLGAQLNQELDREYPSVRSSLVELTVLEVPPDTGVELIREEVEALLPPGSGKIPSQLYNGTLRQLVLRLEPVPDPKAFADRIRFGKVIQLKGRRLRVRARPISEADLAAFRARHAPVTPVPPPPSIAATTEPPPSDAPEPTPEPIPAPTAPPIAVAPPAKAPARKAPIDSRPLPESGSRVTLPDAPGDPPPFFTELPESFHQERDSFRNLGPSGGILVGFVVAHGDFVGNPIIGSIRPVYRVGKREVIGAPYGRQGANPVKVVARSGYAVGGINFRAGLGLDGFELVFMKINGDQLDPHDSYSSPWMGNTSGGGPGSVHSDGRLVIGVHGRAQDNLNRIGLIVLHRGGLLHVSNRPADRPLFINELPQPFQRDRDGFRALAPRGGLLVGVVVTYGEWFGKATVGSVRPVFRRDNQDMAGPRYGSTGSDEEAIVARPGYAVGGINFRAGLTVDGFQLVFMKVKGDRLDPSDTYLSPWMGNTSGGGPGSVTSEGRPVLGLIGRAEKQLNRIGLLVGEGPL